MSNKVLSKGIGVHRLRIPLSDVTKVTLHTILKRTLTRVSDKLTRRGRTNILIQLITDIMSNNNNFDIYIYIYSLFENVTTNSKSIHLS